MKATISELLLLWYLSQKDSCIGASVSGMLEPHHAQGAASLSASCQEAVDGARVGCDGQEAIDEEAKEYLSRFLKS